MMDATVSRDTFFTRILIAEPRYTVCGYSRMFSLRLCGSLSLRTLATAGGAVPPSGLTAFNCLLIAIRQKWPKRGTAR